jgi:hypothetical protein
VGFSSQPTIIAGVSWGFQVNQLSLKEFRGFLKSNVEILARLCHDGILPNPFQFITDPSTIQQTDKNNEWLPMSNGLTEEQTDTVSFFHL